MPPLLQVGTLLAILLLRTTSGDVSHILGASPHSINSLASPQPNQFWWMADNSPLKAAYDHTKQNGANYNQVVNINANPFLNGQYQPSSKPAAVTSSAPKPNYGANPFLTAGNGDLIDRKNEFLGVQPKRPGFATAHPLAKKPAEEYEKGELEECRGSGVACVKRELCQNGVINRDGAGIVQVRSEVQYCSKKQNEVCCHLPPNSDHRLTQPNLNEITSGKSSVPTSGLKFEGGAGLSPGFIQLLPSDESDLKPEVRHHSASNTPKTVRDVSSIANTPDYSDVQFDSSARLPSSFQGPAYLPPLSPTTQRPFVQPQPQPTRPPFVQPQPQPTRPPFVQPQPQPTRPPFVQPQPQPTRPPFVQPQPQPTRPPYTIPVIVNQPSVNQEFVRPRPSSPKPFQPPSPAPYQPTATSPRPTTSREYLPPVSYSPQPSSPRPNPFIPRGTQPPVTQTPYQPSPSSTVGYTYPSPSPIPSRPTFQPSIPSYQPPAPSRPTPAPYQPSPSSTSGYTYPRPSPTSPAPSRPSYQPPAPSRPTPAPYQPSPSSTSGYTYPRPSPTAPAPSRPSYQPPAPSRPTPAPYQPSPSSTSGYTYPRPSPSQPSPSTYQPPAPSRPSFQPPRPTQPPYQPSPSSTGGYTYPTPPAPSKPSYQPPVTSRPSYQPPAPSIPSYQPPAPSRPTQPPYQPSPSSTSGYTYPRPTAGLPSRPPVTSSPTYRPSPRPQITPSVRPSNAGYTYPRPTPSFDLPSPTPPTASNNINNQYVRPPPTSESPNAYLPPGSASGSEINTDYVQRPTSPRPRPAYEPDNPTDNTNTNVNVLFPPRDTDATPPTSCAAALKCVQAIYCTADGFVAPVPVVLSAEQEASRVPTTDCRDLESGSNGVCCRDPSYVDPWPSANLVNGVDDGRYAEDASLGQYRRDLTRSVRSNGAEGGRCGVRHLGGAPQGAGALDVDFAEIPWQAMVLRDGNRSLLCGGAIVREDAVLTAAHCVEGLATGDVLVKGGEWKLGIDEEPLPFQIVKVAAIVRHPEWVGGAVNDMAVLVLAEKLRMAKNVGVVCLPEINRVPTENCIATGWGKRILQLHAKGAIMHSINVNIMDNAQCEEALNTKFKESLPKYSPNTLCGFSDIDQCRVDYGSALACSNGNGQYTLSGIYAWDTGCKSNGQIGGYVAPDVEWIETTLAKPLKQLRAIDRAYQTSSTN